MWLLALLATRGLADNDDDDTREVRDTSARRVKVEVDGNSGEIEARSKSKAVEDKLKIKFKVDEQGHKSEIYYYSKSSDSTDATKQYYYFRFNLLSLIEFQDNAPAGFGDEDQVFNKVFFGKKNGWTKMTPSIKIEDGDVVNDILKWSTTSGPLTVTAYYSPNAVKANGTNFDPDEVKFDYDIWYDWTPTATQGSCTGSACKLAIDARVKTRLKSVQKSGSRDVGAVDTTVTKARGGWHWKNTVTADNVTVAVIPSPVRNTTTRELDEDLDKPEGDEKSYTTIFTFDAIKPNHIYWDPALYASDATSVKPFFFLALTLLSVFFAL